MSRRIEFCKFTLYSSQLLTEEELPLLFVQRLVYGSCDLLSDLGDAGVFDKELRCSLESCIRVVEREEF